MAIKDLVKPELVFAKQALSSKKRVLEFIAQAVGDRLHCEADEVYDALLSREKLGSTGVGNGIGIPHCRLDKAHQATMVVISLADTIDFDSIDRKPVDLIFALIVPPEQCDSHLQTLAAIAELAQSTDKLSQLRAAGDNAALLARFQSSL
ncbi:PTS fructose transporter subunit IIA [Maribrevibacterium harenarium]|uniref:PTS fructose transporter subunit IIA n=1 Tax=Maribrevibacterium harenarium TaxID=2589817 RepID=A0A501WSE9_9GAMM|nr:PTS sugar transporter subunit IIA [Maribrevibacterium harenarium]TPE52359.1 PTS fructose transporter subunit IIA [Maribrevibacterium harenarium]